MANNNRLAYPYANALYDIAKAEDKIEIWLCTLKTLGLIGKMCEFKSLIYNPTIKLQQIIEILTSCLGLEANNKEVINFLTLLYSNGRLNILQEIFLLFEKMYDDDNKIGKSIIESAFSMSDEDKEQIEKLLSKKFGRNISAKVKVNPSLIGGIKIIIDDIVIDASIMGGLNKMATQLMR